MAAVFAGLTLARFPFIPEVSVFKNLIVYRIVAGWSATPEQVEESLAQAAFAPCGATQPLSLGWTAPRGTAHGPLIEFVGGQWLMKLKIEQKVLPASVVKRRAEERALQIEQTTGRKPGKKEAKELRDEATLDLLPQAFTKQAAVPVWIDPKRQLLMVDAGSVSKADQVVTLLVKSLAGLVPMRVHTAESPTAVMAAWLLDGSAAPPFTVDRECELKSADEMKSVVRYARHPLDTDEVRQHIEAGKLPTRLALTWRDRVSFVLTDAMQLKKIVLLDGVMEGQGRNDKADDAFDADAAIATGELAPLIADLIDALGGEQAPGTAAASPTRLAVAVNPPADREPVPA